MELAVQAAALCAAGALLTLVVKSSAPAVGFLLSVGILVTIFLLLSSPVVEIFTFFRELGERSGLPDTLLSPLFKTLGIALTVRVSAGLCRDAGESALAAAVEAAGSLCALLVSLPLLRAVSELLLELME